MVFTRVELTMDSLEGIVKVLGKLDVTLLYFLWCHLETHVGA
jgi:hypothetical protein